MPAMRAFRHTAAPASGPRTTTHTWLAAATVPNSRTSGPTKPVVIWIWCSDRSAISGVWLKPGAARAMIATDSRTARNLISMTALGADGEEVWRSRHQVEQQIGADRQHQHRKEDAKVPAGQAGASAGAALGADPRARLQDEGEETVDRS